MLSRGQVERAERDMNAIIARINETVKHRCESPKNWHAWQEASEALHAYRSPVFLLWQPKVLAAIRKGQRHEIEGALAFLEADPYFFRISSVRVISKRKCCTPSNARRGTETTKRVCK